MKTNINLIQNTQKYRKTPKGVLTNSYSHQKQRRYVGYSLNELQNKFLNNKRFLRLHNEWLKSGCKKELTPSVDRINCKKGYTIDNIHILTWSENKYKQRMETKIFRAKKCYMHINGKIVKVFTSQWEVVKKTGLAQGNLSMALNGKRRTCGGYNWSYDDPNLINK